MVYGDSASCPQKHKSRGSDGSRNVYLRSIISPDIHIEHLYSPSSRELLRSASNTSTVKQSYCNGILSL